MTETVLTARRIQSLDGLRGIAAVVVVLYHLLLVASSTLSGSPPHGLWFWATRTPLKLLFAGPEAVLVFFVLSGLVVALPALDRGFSWPAFMISRALRLYAPVWAALAFACVLIVVVPREAANVADNAWLTDYTATSLQVGSLLREASLLFTTYTFDNALWSLRWEVYFSLLLPLFLGIAVVSRRALPVLTVVALGISVVGRMSSDDALTYLPLFFVGVAFAVSLNRIAVWSARRSAAFWIGAPVASALLLICGWLVRSATDGTPVDDAILGHNSLYIGNNLFYGLEGVGAAGIVLSAVGSPGLRRLLERGSVLWLGKISFSLYLVHIPILATVSFLVGDRRWWLVAAIVLPTSILAAWAFHGLVESRLHLLARRAGAATAGAIAAARDRMTATGA